KNTPSSPSFENVAEQVRLFLIYLDKDILKTIANPSLNFDEKKDILKEIIQQLPIETAKVSTDFVNVLNLLLENRRFECIYLTLEYFLEKVDEAIGIARIEFTSSRPLSTEEIEEFKKVFSSSTGKKIILNYTTDPALLVGFKAKIKNINIDASLSLYLSNLKASLNWGV
ncbi:MAG: ATP synthase F1 subunit delta, partial [Silvanigrellaceae bacterium]|nr:ATP synthase F1 subunit delta [Silvanigrellaceae bacterium]